MPFQLEELSLELTNRCPMACLHCSSGSSPEAMPGELSFDQHCDLIVEAADMGATVVSFSGGEPLVYPQLPDLVEWAVAMEYERILIYTTGHHDQGAYVYQHPDIARLMDAINVTWIFSLHSHMDAVHDRIMNVPNSWVRIRSSIEWLTKRGVDVEVHMVPMKPNFSHIAQTREMCRTMGVRKLSLLRFVPQTRGHDNLEQLDIGRTEFLQMQVVVHMEYQKRGHTTELRLGCPIDFRHAVRLIGEKSKPCHAGDDLMLVRPTGNVHPCAAWKSLACDANVKQHSLQHIWTNSDVFEYVRWFKQEGYEDVSGCEHCAMLGSCKTGCLAQRLHAYGTDLNTLTCDYSDPLCPRGHTPDGEKLVRPI